jgi:DNA-binding PucR family transcriptional regulator
MLISREIVVRDAFDEWKIAPPELEAMLKFQIDGRQALAYLGRDKLLERTDQIARLAEARTGATQVRDASGRPAKVDRMLTAAAIWAAAQSDDRTVDLQWAT